MPSTPPFALRASLACLVAAVGCEGLSGLLGVLPGGALATLGLSLIVIAPATAWLGCRMLGSGRSFPSTLAFLCVLLLVPALGMAFWIFDLGASDLDYIDRYQALPTVLDMAADVGLGSAPLALSAAVVAAVWLLSLRDHTPCVRQPAAWLPVLGLLTGGLASLCSSLCFAHAASLLRGGLATAASGWALTGQWASVVPLALMALPGLVFARRNRSLTLLALCILFSTQLCTTPPFGRYLAHFPPEAGRHGDLPADREPGSASLDSAIDPRGHDLASALVGDRHLAVQSGPLWGDHISVAPWPRLLRNTVTLALPPATTVAELLVYGRVLALHGAFRLCLLGQAPVTGSGLLATYLSSPSAAFLLDEPSVQYQPSLYLLLARDGEIGWWRRDTDTWGWASDIDGVPLSGLVGTSCMLVPQAEVAISRLYQLSRLLGGPRHAASFPQAVGLAFPSFGAPAAAEEERPVEAAFVEQVLAVRPL